MSSGGFMSLAYMAELGAVINLAYLELKSFRYLGVAKEYVSEAEQSLKSHNSNNGNHSLFVELYKRVTDLFSEDQTERDAAWYIKNKSGKKVYFKYCSGYFFGRFNNQRDRIWSTRYLCASVFIIVLITILNQISIDDLVSSRGTIYIWWFLFCTLFLSIAVPASFIMMGRRLQETSKQIMDDIRDQKNVLAESTFNSVMNHVQSPLDGVKSNVTL